MVKPTIQALSVIEEDYVSSPLASPSRPEFAGRSASPAFSMFSAISSRTAGPRAPRAESPPKPAPSANEPDAAVVEAHRQR